VTLLTAELKGRIGDEVVYRSPDELGRAAIRYFALAIGDDNPLYLDDDYAKAHGHPSVIAPPTLVCETNQFVPGPRDAEGYLTQMFSLDVPGTRQIRGGNSYEFFRPVLPTDRITISWRLEDIAERTTSAGVEMLVVTSVATYTNGNGDELARNTETIIYQAVLQ
jgi:acyl dehydratase